ncbi:MAG TPA: hypothetical protein VFY65_05770 [Longimicrobium sp.]|nr:hypothetical protein [Longimicrobium sp.]
MKKLRLDVDALRVESFGTGTVSAGGTVNAHIGGIAPETGPVIITDPVTDRSRVDSCYFNTCYETCDWTV